MATYLSSNAIGEKENLADVITRIDPDETPLFSNMNKIATKAITYEWQTQELASASATNHANEGADYSYVNPTATVRNSNHHQIFVQAGAVSKTLDVVDKAGRDRETAYVKVLKGIEQRRDIEKSLCSSTAKSSSDPRKFGSIETWLTNVSSGSGSTDATGDGSDVRTDAGARALTLAQIDTVMQACYSDGGQPDMLVVSPSKKATFSDLSSGSVATNQIQMTANAPRDAVIIGSVSMYLTDYGTLNVVIDRQMQDDRVYLLDSDYMQMGALPNRSFSVNDVAPTGDAEKFAIVSEMTFIPTAPKAHGAVFDLS
tara:strand:+ start:102 stop:1043 length:942 start_codon:yes stop_codon:yes gene_type:complete